ncbi:hypothetical protein C5167_027796 [Papaver somniferum]|uniref:uncharacterized protein LOC113339245 n=1 Tax=Papaver somniferum TaxID=3469 RepID=UPI000E6FCE9C|nr:uncharacterized protein LOC113339245 [Papaver somniferum]RZC91740.1 hypothetical protein C5167_027796 [Papaver somniferum]
MADPRKISSAPSLSLSRRLSLKLTGGAKKKEVTTIETVPEEDASTNDQVGQQQLTLTPTEEPPKIIHINDFISVNIDDFVPEAGYQAMITQIAKDHWEKGKEVMDGYNKISDQKKMIEKIMLSRIDIQIYDKASTGQLKFMEDVVNTLESEDLKETHKNMGGTALHLAAIVGCTRIVKAISSKCSTLTGIPDKDGNIPLVVAAENLFKHKQKEMVEHLCDVTPKDCTELFTNVTAGGRLICNIINADHYDTACRLIKKFPQLAIAKDDSGSCALEVLAQRPFAFQSGSWLTPWQRIKYSAIKVDLATHEPRRTSPYVYNSPDADLEKGEEYSDLDLYLQQHQGFFTRRFHEALGLTYTYKEKLMHRQALELVKCICKELPKVLSSTKSLDDAVEYINRNVAIKDEKRLLKDFFENTSILSSAASSGAVEVLEECIQILPELVMLDMEKQSPLAVAIGQRTDRIFNLILDMTNDNKDKFATVRDKEGNTLLHLAAKLAPSTRLSEISGPALRMQRELQWFKEVEHFTPQKDRLITNKSGMTARALFTEEHEKLMKQGEEWMQRTAGSCMVVAALVTTVVFAAAFTIPGGNHSESNSEKNGTPIFLNNTSFLLFLAADAFGLFSSLTSVLAFLSILTSSYTEKDFLKSLPKKLILGLLSLFLSVVSMMIAFSAALSIVLGHRFSWFPLFITIITCVFLITYAVLQLPLFIEMVRATYWPTLFRSKGKLAKILRQTSGSVSLHKNKRQ